MLMSAVIQQENEKAGVGVTEGREEGRMQRCVFTQLGGFERKRGERK